MAKLLATYRSMRNHKNLPILTIEQILDWADKHQAATGNWPKKNTGQVTGADESMIPSSFRHLCAKSRTLPGALGLLMPSLNKLTHGFWRGECLANLLTLRPAVAGVLSWSVIAAELALPIVLLRWPRLGIAGGSSC